MGSEMCIRDRDLKGFLLREMDFYIKNEILVIDDIDTTDTKKFSYGQFFLFRSY